MDYRTAEYLIVVARTGTLRAAAGVLGVSQPTLSKAIRRLEDEIDAPMFLRAARGMTLTVYGEAMLRQAHSIRACVEGTYEEIHALKQGLSGRVRIGAGPSWQRSVLPEAAEVFRQERPQVRLEIVGGMDDRLKAHLRAGELDIVLAAMPAPIPIEPDLTGHALIEDEYGIIARASHPLAGLEGSIPLRALEGQNWILPGRGSILVMRLNTIFQAQGLPPPNAILETDINALKMSMMENADYLSFHALGQLRESSPSSIVPLSVPEARWRRSAGIIMRQGITPSPAANAMIAAIEQVCARATLYTVV